jgi:uncharacterized protein (DUF983 family)
MSMSHAFRIALKRGIFLRCPQCGQGRLLSGYLTQAENCAVCHEDFTAIRADDAPPWLTIFIVGHIMAPIILTVESYKHMSLWAELTLMSALALLLVFLILPRAKGFFIALTWALRQNKPA